jgi:hypothetical protein
MASRATAFLLCLLCSVARGAQPWGTDLDGRPVDLLAPHGTRAVVLFFAASDCPIANRYIPEIERLEQQYSPSGVQFWWVYPNPRDTAAVVRQHDAQFDIRSHALLDTDQHLTHMAHVTVTPEAAVFVPSGANLREVYRGRIDDRYLELGRERPAATRHVLEQAIAAVLADRTVPSPGGPTIGCSIVPRNEP